jgi:excisionase family DNA binding protein
MSQRSEGRFMLLSSGAPINTQSDSNRAVYTVREVAHLLSLSLGVTYALVRSGEIPARRLGRCWVIPCARFQQWLDACTVESGPASPDRETSVPALGRRPRRDP